MPQLGSGLPDTPRAHLDEESGGGQAERFAIAMVAAPPPRPAPCSPALAPYSPPPRTPTRGDLAARSDLGSTQAAEQAAIDHRSRGLATTTTMAEEHGLSINKIVELERTPLGLGLAIANPKPKPNPNPNPNPTPNPNPNPTPNPNPNPNPNPIPNPNQVRLRLPRPLCGADAFLRHLG